MSANPIRARQPTTGRVGHYCEKLSDGCTNCYSSALQPRLFGLPEFQAQRADATIEMFLHLPELAKVRRRRKPARIFWCDMTDMFGAWVHDDWIAQCFAVMAATPQHIHLVLTKRPERMHAWVKAHYPTPLPHVFLGTSVEDQRTADQRLPWLLKTPAAVRFLSVEPLLGPIALTLAGMAWVIVGGESGAKRRPMDLAWLEAIAAQCDAAGVPLYVKQDSAFRPGQQGRIPDGLWTRKEFPQTVSAV